MRVHRKTMMPAQQCVKRPRPSWLALLVLALFDAAGCGGRNLDEQCSSIDCAVSCEQNLTTCSGSCADLKTDRTHCGSCGHVCPAEQNCMNGVCVLNCVGG